MGGQFAPKDPLRCPHYAGFAHGLDRKHFDALYWVLFIIVVVILFFASWIYQRTMMYRDHPQYCEETFRRKLRASIAATTALFLVAAITLVFEVYALLALQFCDGEDLMSLYWSTWTMLQLGSEIAILGIVLALWHHLYDIRHPLWALALGTPVLVVAGIGHVISVIIEMFYKKAKQRKRSGTDSRDVEKNATNNTSSASSMKAHHEQRETRTPIPGQEVYFTLDVGGDERILRWPACVGMFNEQAVLKLTAVSDSVIFAGMQRPEVGGSRQG
ncbi:hypothetical protein F4780DRAFT_197491 [Xylariomycetidae sp. FL0641]|nr:hypothetical protein F4780DRAFT_197491 [Xylariomycetidae sp. FL0641]